MDLIMETKLISSSLDLIVDGPGFREYGNQTPTEVKRETST